MQPALRTLSKSFERHLLATSRSARIVQTYLCALESLERIEAQMKQENEAARVELTIVAQAPGLDTPAQAEVIEFVSLELIVRCEPLIDAAIANARA